MDYKKIEEEYNNKLKQLYDKDPKVVKVAFESLQIKKLLLKEQTPEIIHKISNKMLFINNILGTDNSQNYNEKEVKDFSKDCFNLLDEYKKALKNNIKDNLVHITNVSKDDLEGGMLRSSKNKLTQYEEEIGDFYFASSYTSKDNPYLIRTNNDGMFKLNNDKNLYLLGNDNIEVKDSEDVLDKRKKVLLNKPGYIYKIKPDKFTPVVTIDFDKENPHFKFNEEWISKELDEKDIEEIEEYRDVTNVLEKNQIFCDLKGNTYEEMSNLDTKDKKKAYCIDKIVKGEVRYLNDEANINKLIDIKVKNQYREER